MRIFLPGGLSRLNEAGGRSCLQVSWREAEGAGKAWHRWVGKGGVLLLEVMGRSTGGLEMPRLLSQQALVGGVCLVPCLCRESLIWLGRVGRQTLGAPGDTW